MKVKGSKLKEIGSERERERTVESHSRENQGLVIVYMCQTSTERDSEVKGTSRESTMWM